MTQTRRPSAIDAVAEAHLRRVVELSPIAATALGLPGDETGLDDFSPDGLQAVADAERATLTALGGLGAIKADDDIDDIDRVTLEAMHERLGVGLESFEAGLPLMSLNVLECPLQAVRDILDLMPTESASDWRALAARVEAIPRALRQWRESLLEARARGLVAPRRQVLACIDQAEGFASPQGYFAALTARAGTDPQAAAALAAVEGAARAARDGYARCAQALREDLLEVAPESDACGPQRYALLSRAFLGARIDLAETYAWGLQELADIEAQRREVADRITPGGGIEDAAQALERDERYRLHDTDALVGWMQERADEAVDALAGVHFEIPEALRRIDARIAPTQTGGIYYTNPSDDLSRPGTMWWSVPPGVSTFSTWQELTTVYHEGVPGHHLQVGQAVANRDRLNGWRRMLSWTSGHGEGWALYAERLMDELGFMEDPGNRLGFLDAQSMRAARVVIDIGVHCGFPAPDPVGGGPWTYDKAWAVLRSASLLPEPILRFELDRYLGWPGQAPAYKVGERIWMALREQVATREGAAFEPRDFHRRALDLGGVGLDTLQRAMLGTWQRDVVPGDAGRDDIVGGREWA